MEVQEFISSVNSLRNELHRQAKHYLGSPLDAEDAVQETLIKLWLAKHKVDDEHRLKSLAFVICRNVSLNILREVRHTTPIDNAADIPMQGNPHTLMEEGENREKLKECIDSLTDKQRALIRMRNVENMSYADMARIIGTSESSVRGMISKARSELIMRMKVSRP